MKKINPFHANDLFLNPLKISESFKKFRNTSLKLGPPTPDFIYRIHHPLGLKLLSRLRLDLSHMNKHRFKHNFENCIKPFCTCSLEVESTKHFFLHCHYYSAIRISFLNDLDHNLHYFLTMCLSKQYFENDYHKMLETIL